MHSISFNREVAGCTDLSASSRSRSVSHAFSCVARAWVYACDLLWWLSDLITKCVYQLWTCWHKHLWNPPAEEVIHQRLSSTCCCLWWCRGFSTHWNLNRTQSHKTIRCLEVMCLGYWVRQAIFHKTLCRFTLWPKMLNVQGFSICFRLFSTHCLVVFVILLALICDWSGSFLACN